MLPKIATAKQKLMFDYGSVHNYALIAADPRLGKTLSAIFIQKLRNVNTLIICPSYLVPNWKKEILKWSPKSQVTTFTKGSDIYEVVDADFVVISFDLAKKAEHLFSWCDQIVIDEVHNLKSMSAKRTDFIHRAVYENSVKYMIGLTGTPLKNRVREFYSLIALTYYDPNYKPKPGEKSFLDAFPDEITFAEHFSFRDEYKVKVKTKRGATFQMPVVRYYGLKNVKELKKWLKGRYIRIRADASDLPPVAYKDILISESPNKKLLAAFNTFFDQEDAGSVRPDVKVAAAVQKVPFTIAYVTDLMQTAKCCLVYSDHKEPIKKIAAHFKTLAITGEMSAKNRAQAVKDFQAGKIDILCATIGSLKEGSDLFRAEDMVLNDYSWIPSDMIQVVNRMRALGEKAPRTVHRMFGSPQDQTITAVIEDKIKTIDAAT